MDSKGLHREADRRCNTIVEGDVDDMAIVSLVRVAYEIAAQLADLNEGIRLLVPKPVCQQCHGQGWICIHCDKALDECQCPDDGSRNPGSCDKCGMTGVEISPLQNSGIDEDDPCDEETCNLARELHNKAMAQPVSDPENFTRCDICEKEVPRPSHVPIGEPTICDECIPF